MNQPLLDTATRAEQREAIIADLRSDIAVDAYVDYVRDTAPSRKAMRIAGLVIAAAGLFFFGGVSGFGYATVRDEAHMPLTCTGEATESKISIDESCARIEAFAGGAGARRRLTAMKSQYSCLPHYRIPITGTDGKVTFAYHATTDIARGGSHKLAVIVMHGAYRDADNYFCMMHSLMKKQPYRDPKDIVVISPDFNYANDEGVVPTDAFWNSSKPWGDWRAGAESSPESGGGQTVSAYHVMDTLVMALNNTAFWPQMDEVAIVGHSAGGQFVQRWAVMTNLPPKIPGLDIRFVIANPSSFAYFTKERLKYSCGTCACSTKECECDGECTNEQDQLQGGKGIFATPVKGFSKADSKEFVCGNRRYDNWPYGLSGRWGYTAARDMKEALAQYAERDIVYLNGQNDTCNDMLPTCNSDCWMVNNVEAPCFRNRMDARCPAMLQGPWRKVRGMQYMQFLENYYGKPVHQYALVNGVGHNATGIFFSSTALKHIFDLEDEEVDAHPQMLQKLVQEYPNILAHITSQAGEDEADDPEDADEFRIMMHDDE